jgi:hypothetical protein
MPALRAATYNDNSNNNNNNNNNNSKVITFADNKYLTGSRFAVITIRAQVKVMKQGRN